MPIHIKDYSWDQNEKFVTIDLVLPVGHLSSKAEINVGREMISLTSQNHIFRIALYREIVKDESTLKLFPYKVEINLKKKEPCPWEGLMLSKSGKELTEMYLELLEEEKQNIAAKSEAKRVQLRADKDTSVKRQLDAEKVKRDARERFKQDEKDSLTQTIEVDQKNEPLKVIQTKSKTNQEISFSDVKKEPTLNIRRSKMPPPRQRGKIQVEFTERSFPTPMRESNKPEEDAWLQKQAAARKRVEYANDDLRPQEKEDGYLEEKAEKMIANGDYESAINALEIAKKLFPRKPSIYLLKAEANLGFQNAIRAAEDAARAFEMYQPPVQDNLHQRVKCHLLRGQALRRLQMYTEALMDFVEAEKLCPKDEEIKQHCTDVRNIIQNNSGDGWKEEWATDLL